MLDIVVSSPHSPLTEGLETAVNRHLAKLAAHHHSKARAHVVLHADHAAKPAAHRVDIDLFAEGHHMAVSAQGSDMYAAIGKAAQLMDRQWRKHKTAALKKIRHPRPA